MASFNKVILMGNLTRDPELRTTQGGVFIAKLSIAVNRKFTTKDGEQREEVTFVDIDAFGKQAEVLQKYAQKGTLLLVEGRLKLDQWENNQGEKRSKLGVILENFQFGGGNQQGQSQAAANAAPRQASTPQPQVGAGDDDPDEDLPF